MSHSGEPTEVSPKNSTKTSDLSGIVKNAKPFEDQKQLAGAVAITGVVRKASSSDSLVLVMDPQPVPWNSVRVAIEINQSDVIEHEVVRELAEGDKVLRVHVRPDAALTMSTSIKASNLSQNTRAGVPQQQVMKNLYEDNYVAVKVIGDGGGGTIQETIWNEWWRFDPAAFGSVAGQVSEPHPEPWGQQGPVASQTAMPFVLAAPHMAPSMQGVQQSSGAQFAPAKLPWMKEVNLDNPIIWKHPMTDVPVKTGFSDPIPDPRSWVVNPVNPQAGVGAQQSSFMPMMAMMSSAPQFGWRSWGPGKRPGSDPGKEPGWDRVQQ